MTVISSENHRRPLRDHRGQVGTPRRRSDPHPARRHRQRRLRRLLALPPGLRTPAALPRHSPRPVHTQCLTPLTPNEPHPSRFELPMPGGALGWQPCSTHPAPGGSRMGKRAVFRVCAILGRRQPDVPRVYLGAWARALGLPAAPGTVHAVSHASLQADLLNAQQRASAARVQQLEHRLSELLGEHACRESVLGAPADIDALKQQNLTLEQHIVDLRLQTQRARPGPRRRPRRQPRAHGPAQHDNTSQVTAAGHVHHTCCAGGRASPGT